MTNTNNKRSKNTRKTMYKSNRIAKEWLLSNGWNYLVTIGHTRRGFYHTWKEDNKIRTRWFKDLYGMFDQIAIKDGFMFFIQIKTNAFPKTDPIMKFLNNLSFARALAINVIKNKVRVRLYDSERVKEITPNIKNFVNYEKFCEKEGLVP